MIFRTLLAAACAIALVVGPTLVPFEPAFAATDPIVDFCASAAASADAQARKECDDYAKYQAATAKSKVERDTVQGEVNAINAEIALAQQKIKVQERIIASLSSDISAKTKVVNSLQTRIDRQTKSIADLVQKMQVRDSVSVAEVLLGSDSFSDFYVEGDSYEILNRQLVELVAGVKSDKAETEAEKQALQNRKDRETDAKQAIEAEKRLIDRKKAEKAALLAVKTAEHNATQQLAEAQRQKVAAIRSKLFKLQDGEGIPFGEAYDYAVAASKVTGVRPAFVLGILMQESGHTADGFGTNVGQCFVRNDQTGAGVGANTGTDKIRVMSPTRDIPIFKRIAADLGRDWQNTRVSCWIPMYSKGQPYGWGGAMGPAQFIASTWDNGTNSSIMKRTARALGEGSSDPWNPEHAIMAASLFLYDLGAGLQTYSAEKNAACRYYSGKSCASSTDGNGYGNSVMRWVTKIQEEMIDPLTR